MGFGYRVLCWGGRFCVLNVSFRWGLRQYEEAEHLSLLSLLFNVLSAGELLTSAFGSLLIQDCSCPYCSLRKRRRFQVQGLQVLLLGLD